jgi:gluconate 5-dehydrogenase
MKLFDLNWEDRARDRVQSGDWICSGKGACRSGARVIINGRDPERLQNAHKKLQDAGIETITRAFDVTDPRSVEDAFAEMESSIGPIHILVANAGIMRRAPATEMPPETWREVLGTNLDGVWHRRQAAGKRIVPRGAGKIITICSVQSELGRPTIAPYAASKGALRMLTRTLGAEWAKHGVNAERRGTGLLRNGTDQRLGAERRLQRLALQTCPRRTLGQGGRIGGRHRLPRRCTSLRLRPRPSAWTWMAG